jgi:hypothetical protein
LPILLSTDPLTTAAYVKSPGKREGSVKFEPEMKKVEPSPHRRPPPWLSTDQFLRNMDGNVICCDILHFAASPRQATKTFVQ